MLSSRPRDRTHVSCFAGRFFTIWAIVAWEECFLISPCYYNVLISAAQLRDTLIHIYIFFLKIFFHGLSLDTEYSSLLYSRALFIHSIYKSYICSSQPPTLSLHHPFHPREHKSVLSVSLFLPHVCTLTCVRLFVTPWTTDHHALLSM